MGTLQRNKAQARELEDTIRSMVIEDDLPLEVLEHMVGILKENIRQIKETVTEITEKERVLHGTDTGAALL